MSGAKADAILARSSTAAGLEKKKKRKRKDDQVSTATFGGLVIAEEGALGWESLDKDKDDEDTAPSM